MSLEKLKHEVLLQAERQAKAILDEAERERDKIIGEAKEKAKAIVAEKQKLGETQAKELAAELKASALLQAKRVESEAKEEVVESVLGEVKRELESFSKTKAYEKIFDSLAKQAIRALGEKEFVLKTNARDKKLGSKHGRVSETISTAGGLIAAKADGSIQINNTFEALLEEHQEKIKQKAFEGLFATRAKHAPSAPKREAKSGGREKKKRGK
ncbi:MAG: V-type ATP synthase subunit E family protein [Candidatus Norongarragalinales archaeon]